ncbi:MAG: aminotransferase class I/II-fold pyridoxal phosphate-dependent enzyme, partial [Planctomycetota bacterium]
VEDWRRRGLGRSLERPSHPIDFTSSDVLGLSRHPALVRAAREAVERDGIGGRAARLLGGGSPRTSSLEAGLAAWLDADAALLLPSGFQANVTLLPAIAGPGDVVVSDALNHASLIDGLRLSRADVRIANHGDVEHVAHHLASARGARRRFVVTESIFSMDGDAAPLPELSTLCAKEGAGLVVDEAHATGVVGPEGRGGFAASGADPGPLVARIVTCGKALGAVGAFVAGSVALRDLLVHRGRGFVFSTAVSPAVVGALEASLELVPGADAERAHAKESAARVASALGLPAPAAAIVPIPVGSEERVLALGEALGARGVGVGVVRPPTVPPGTSRLRVVCRADHSSADVDALLDALPATVRTA